MTPQKFDIAVLGGGPGGYPAAIKAAQLGKSVALIEAAEMGGTCLNRGCIPTKTLIANSDVLKRIQESETFGISVKGVSFDFAKMSLRKDDVVLSIRKSLEGLIASNKITVFRGFGKFLSPNEIKANAIIQADKIIIATGSEPREIFPCDGKWIHNSTTILNLTKLPKSLVIVGGGVIGVEFASLYASLGVQVTIVELLERILPMEAEMISTTLAGSFTKRGIVIHTKVKVLAIEKGVVKLEGGKNIEGEMVLISVGRKRNSDNIGLEKAGLSVEPDGEIKTNSKMETEVPGIYAVGDVTGKFWLAHVASHQGMVAAINASGGTSEMHYNAIPSVTFTDPEIATVGLSLEKAKLLGYNAVVGAFPFKAIGKAQAADQTEGFAQIITDRKTGQILGAQVVGHEAGTLIAEMTVAIANELTVECLTETLHAHPTLSEAWLEAAFIARRRS